jgi:hypothetical protein
MDLNKVVKSKWLKILTNDSSENIAWELFPLDIDSDYIANAVATSSQKYLVYYAANALAYP